MLSLPLPFLLSPSTQNDPDAAEKYAQHVAEACTRLAKGKVSAFFIESGMSVAGVVLPPEGYLKRCYEYVRAAGGVCVADEVQVCGREFLLLLLLF